MAFKLFVTLAFLAVVKAGLVPSEQVYHTAPATVVETVAHPVLTKVAGEYDAHPQYKFSYDVEDPVSGDSKSQVEERDGDVVHGEYSLVDADGYKRTVQYTADAVHGFQAHVHREPFVKSASAVAHYATPTVVKTVAPVNNYAPSAIVKTVAPITHYSVPTYAKAVSHVSAPAVIKHVAPLVQYSAPVVVKSAAPLYTSYSAPASYVTHH